MYSIILHAGTGTNWDRCLSFDTESECFDFVNERADPSEGETNVYSTKFSILKFTEVVKQGWLYEKI